VFRSGAAGTYMYRARLGVGAVNVAESDQLAGAFIVDPPGGSAPDRVFVINIWGRPKDSTTYRNALTINGRSWPSTERLEAIVGDTLHWRVINATGRPHPMHLHGAYFRVDSKGNMFSDTTYATDQRRLAVTEVMRARTTMRMVWSPLHEGRWLFHCHLMFHVIPSSARVDTPPGTHEHSVDPMEHMAGLVLGIDARMPSGVKLAGRAKARQLDLYVQEGPQRARAKQSMSFILQQGRTPPRPDSVLLPGSLIVLTRDEPTDITVHNRMKHPTAVHWHGLELESFSDGVAGWGGSAQMPSPPVEAGGTFTARLTMPRAGTFIYHTHLRDGEQLTSGLYGPIVVMEPGKKFDARRDHVHIMGWDGLDKVQGLVNGDSTSSPPIEMRRGETHRFRFINIGAAESGDFTLKRDTVLAEWRPVAKDGADLIAAQRVIRPAAVSVDVGETYDFEFTPTVAGEYVLSAPNNSASKTWERKIFVRK
jgi:FtsP/CotA-like multicopper oxidase with cupredoxin domain